MMGKHSKGNHSKGKHSKSNIGSNPKAKGLSSDAPKSGSDDSVACTKASSSASVPNAADRVPSPPSPPSPSSNGDVCGTAAAGYGVKAESRSVAGVGDGLQDDGSAGFEPLGITLEKDKDHRKKIARRVGIAALSIVGALAVIYLVGVLFFSMHFMPNTYVFEIDASFRTSDEVRDDISDTIDGYSIEVKGHGLDLTLNSEDVGLAADVDATMDAIVASQDPWLWPADVFGMHDMTDALADALSATALSDALSAAVEEVNAESTSPENPKVQYDATVDAFVIVDEVAGTQIDPDRLIEATLCAVTSLDDRLALTDDMLVQPTATKDSPEVIAACDEANSLIKADITLMLGSDSVGSIDSQQISEWVVVSPEYEVSFDESAMSQWASELAAGFNTVGTTRNYTRADGKSITVSGGDYGWSIDGNTLVSELVDSIKAGTVGSIDIPVLQSAKAYSSASGKDWGTRYIDVDITEQHARFYGNDGAIIWESDIVSGTPTSDRATPTGVYDLNNKGKNITLVGRNSDGSVSYETPVAFWMAFKGNSIGFHDATWQSSFGGSRYKTSGSHGCVNLPYAKAESLYGLISVGDVVVVHN